MKRSLWIVCCLLVLAGAWYLWPSGERPVSPVKTAAAPVTAAPAVAAVPVAATNSVSLPAAVITRSAASTNREFFRLTNTQKSLAEMTASPRAILLENALVDTAAGLTLKIPKQLRATGEPGAYIVQSRGVVDGAFRAVLAGAGAQIVSYIPNNAYLVQLTSAGAGALSGNPQVQAVLPFSPYFKVQSSLLGLAVKEEPLPPGQVLTLGLFASGADATVAQIENMGGKILGTDRSPFGPVVRVLPASSNDWLALAQLPGVQRVEPATKRQVANDLARVTMGITTDAYATNANWLNLSGSNVLVEVNDTGIDANHPDFTTGGNPTTAGGAPIRVLGATTNDLHDIDGHGTHVAGVIAGNGAKSYSVTNTPSGSVTNADFRGKAPAATLFSFGFLGANDTNVFVSDLILQETPALTNALISNNSWVNGGANEYDLSAASYDAAVRDALPFATGPQPVLFVFPAGNSGGGDDSGFDGSADTILSPGTAKNVITVGALEQYRGLTNTYTPLGTTNETLAWAGETSSGNQVAAYSSRGNVGVQTEGPYGRFKPDVVAPGTFVLSTRTTTWDQEAYYNPTNYHNSTLKDGFVDQTTLTYDTIHVPINAVDVSIRVIPNKNSPSPFPTNLPVYLSLNNVPDPGDPSTYDIVGTNSLSVPPQSGGAIGSVDDMHGFYVNYAVGDNTNNGSDPIQFDVFIQVVTTNDYGNLLTVLSNLNDTIGPWYYYEGGTRFNHPSGTSIATAAASGSLALMQDFFTNTLHATPSPALLKAMLINGARLSGGYNNYALTNGVNFEGWGLVNVPNSVPMDLTNTASGTTNTAMFFVDQNPTNALATGDSRTYNVSVPTFAAQLNPLHITLAWTDPPGNPAAGIKLVNDLDLIVTNLDNPTNPVVYYGNIFSASTPYSVAVDTNTAPDTINNVENIILPPLLGTNYAVTVVGRNVTVNAVTLDQTNVVQDYALVISCGDSMNTNGISVTPATPASASVTEPTVTFVSSYTNGIYFNQLAGANAPWLSTNDITIDPAAMLGTNADLFVGQTNQWHFYVVTNTTIYTNAAFIIFLPNTLSTPRMGVFEDSTANSTRPEADLNLFVSSDPDASAGQLTNIDLTVISNCVYSVNGDQASLARGGTKFIAYSNSLAGQVYYIGVQCADQMAAEYGFVSVFSENPFSQMQNGNQIVNGLLLPATIPDGNNAHPGVAYVFGLALYPMDVGGITVTNTIDHDNLPDLVGTLTHGTAGVVLNNHNVLGSGSVTTVYNDDGLPGTTNTAGPGSLRNFRGKEAAGPWLMTQVDDSSSAAGSITGFTMNIEPHQDLTHGVVVTVQPGAWWYGYVDSPVGYTNLTVAATNLPPTASIPIEMYLNYNVEPDFTNYLVRADLTNGVPPGNRISYGPPLEPGRYFVGLYNPDTVAHDVYIIATLSFDSSAISKVNWDSTGPLPLLDDAVMPYGTNSNSQFVTNTDIIQGINVGLRVDHERISDLVFHLISPDGTRYLLMENRGGQSTNGAGITILTTNNIANVSAGGSANPSTNYIPVSQLSGTLPISWDFFTVPDQMTVYDNTNGNYGLANLLFNTGMTSGSGQTNLAYTTTSGLTIIMNQFGNTNGAGGDQWVFTAGGVVTNNYYLTFTEDTNLTTTPIKYAVPPFVMTNQSAGSSLFASSSSLETVSAGDYAAPATVDGWSVIGNQVSVVTDATNALSTSNFLALANGVISNSIPTTPGTPYTLSFFYRGPGMIGFWRGESNVTDSIGANTGYLSNGVSYVSGEVGSAFHFDGASSSYIQIPASSSLDVGNDAGVTIDCWIKPADTNIQRPLVVWTTNSPTVSVAVDLGPLINPDNGHYYYLIPANDWYNQETNSELLGGHLATIRSASENDWLANHVAALDMPGQNSRIGLNAQQPFGPWTWISGEPVTYGPVWYPGEPSGDGTSINYHSVTSPTATGWNDHARSDVIRGIAETTSGVDFWMSVAGPGSLYANLLDTTNGSHIIYSASGLLQPNQYQHVAVTYDHQSGVAKLYCNGVVVANTNLGVFTPKTSGNVMLGKPFPNMTGTSVYSGDMDEVSIYDRALSTSEIKAIFDDGTNGKFDTNMFPVSPSQSLADGQININSASPTNFFGDNTTWQMRSITFTATGTTTPVVISGIEPGMLLDSFATAESSSNAALSNLYYQPEQSLDPLIGTSAYGLWQLEVLDNRAGETNNANLVSWQLAFTFANTNFTLATITNGFPGSQTNYIPGGATQWFLVNVPTNADFATNTLIFADLPLNLWWSTNQPPTTTNVPPDTELLAGSTGGSVVLSTNGSPINPAPAFMEPGGFYYLGVQNPNVAGANYAVDVTFHLLTGLLPTVITEPATNIVTGFATLQASVNPVGTNATVYFEYGLTTNYGFFSTNIVLTSNLNLTQLLGINVTNIAPPGSVWHFQAIATNIFGTNYGGDLTFTNPYNTPAPFAFTMPATLVNGSSAQLNGMGTPNGLPTQAWFEWGQSTKYGFTTPPVTIATNYNADYNVVFVNTNITGLMTNWAYHYRLVVSNGVGVAYGFDQVFAQGSVVTWGSDFAGQTTPIPSSLTNLVAGVGAGYDFSLALNFDGTVVAWGDDSSGQTNVPAGLNNAVAVAGGYAHSLALRSDRTVTVWGDDAYNQTNAPSDLTNAVAAASGAYHCLALRDDGNPVAWGRDNNSQTNIPAGLSNVVAVAAGFAHSLALKNDGTVVAWGNNSLGQTDVPAGLTNVVAIAAGHDDSLALRSDGTVVAWGSNANGQTNVPVGLTNVTAITAGYYHCQALKGDGSVWFWGDSSSGQLNGYQGGFTNVNNPGGLTNVFVIAGGGFHTLSVQAPYGLNITNTAPYWTNGFNTNVVITMDELTVTNINNAALDSNSPPQLVFYSLLNPPAFASIDLFSGVITLNPQEVDGPSTNMITTVATDNGYPTLSSTNRFTLVVNEVNTPPFWPNGVPDATNYTIGVGQLLTVMNTASDSDIPANPLSYTVSVTPVTNAPAISTGGIITWTPQGAGIFTVTTIVTDTNPWALFNPSLSATNQFTVTVTNTATPPPSTNAVDISSIVYTNGGFLLTWFAPSNDLFQVQWADSLTGPWQTFTNIVSYNTSYPATATNATFTFFDDGSQAPFGATRFYNVIPYGSGGTTNNTAPVLPVIGTQTANPLNPLVVTNTATDNDVPAQTLTYSLASTVAGTNQPVINTNTGVITWTPDVSQAGTSNVFTTVVTDDGVPSLSATNSFAVIVNPVPDFTDIIYTNGSFLLTWLAPTNDIFTVQVTTNLASPTVWLTLATNIVYTGPVTPTNGWFSYLDNPATTTVPFGSLRFYQLVLTGITSPAGTPSGTNTAPVLPSVVTQIAGPLNPLVVTNTATDSDVPTQTLTYSLTSTVVGTNVPVINTNTGVITWTPDVSQAGTSNFFTTIVTDDGVPPLSATNSFAVIVNPVPDFTGVSYTNGNFLLTWLAPTNDIFTVQVATNLASPTVWLTLATNIVYTGPVTPTNGWFSYLDNPATTTVPFGSLRFYQLVLTGVTPPPNPPAATTTFPISVVPTNGTFTLTWTAPSTNQFKVLWTTNISSPIVWNPFADTITSSNGTFMFTDTNVPAALKFYQLMLLP